MSEQAPTNTGTTVRQPVDSEAVSSTADITGALIVGPDVCTYRYRYGSVCTGMCCNIATHLVNVAHCYNKHALKGPTCCS